MSAPTPREKRMKMLARPQIRLHGTVDDVMYDSFREQLEASNGKPTIALAITTLGGDPEVARAMGDDIRLMCEHHDREVLFLGKVAVYSAGATLMSAFPIENRYLTKSTRLLIHERSICKDIKFDGPLKSLLTKLKQLEHEIEHAILIENEGFRAIVEGSNIDFEDVVKRATDNWYISCEEAKEMGLIADVV